MSELGQAYASNAAAYKQTLQETESPREMERRVFSQVTRALQDAEAARLPVQLDENAQEALERNQQLWGALMFDVADQENGLPQALRAQIISLALFVDNYTGEVLAGRKPVRLLIELNQMIIRGLQGVRPETTATG